LTISEILILTIYLTAFSYALLKCSFFKIPNAKSKLIISLWGYKVLAGVLFYLIFTFYQPYSHGSDSTVYYEDAIELTKVANEHPLDYAQLITGFYTDESQFNKYTTNLEYWNRSYPSVIPNDNRIVIRLNSLFSFISFKYYSVHLLLMAFLSFIGLLLLYKAIFPYFHQVKKMLVFAIFIIPSTVFWSAGNLKEPILIFLLGCFVYNLIKSTKEKPIKHLFFLAIISFALTYTKPYVLFLLIPISIALFLSERYKSIKVRWVYLAVFLLFGCFIAIITAINPEYSIAKLLTNKQHDFISMVSAGQSGSKFDIPYLNGTYLNIFINSPNAFLNSLSRPLIWEPKTWTQLLAALENLVVIMILMLLSIRFRFSKISNINFWIFFAILGVQLLILTGLITPNMGALVRYKSVGLPFIFIALLAGWSLTDTNGKSHFNYDIFQFWRKKINSYFWS